MSEPIANSGSVAVGNGQVLSQSIAQEIAAGVAASLSEITAKMNQLLDTVTENIKKQSLSDDRGFSTEVTGAHDIYENVRRTDVARDRIQVQAEIALANAVELAKAIGIRSLDHFSSLPPVAKQVV